MHRSAARMHQTASFNKMLCSPRIARWRLLRVLLHSSEREQPRADRTRGKPVRDRRRGPANSLLIWKDMLHGIRRAALSDGPLPISVSGLLAGSEQDFALSATLLSNGRALQERGQHEAQNARLAPHAVTCGPHVGVKCG